MSTNGTRTGASKLFDLFRDRDEFDILNGEGEQVQKVTLQALDWQQNNAVIKSMEQARLRVRAEMAKNGDREGIEDSVSQLTSAQLIDVILGMERPIASGVADLAPNGTAEENEAAKAKEAEATKKWEESRKKELEGMELPDLRDIVVRRQESLFIQARAVADYINESLCAMVIDPTSGDPEFSTDEKAPNYVGRLMPEIRNQLLKFREEFLGKRGEKQIRKAAEDKNFLASGESPKAATDSPGETTETPPRSRRTRSPSTTVADG